MRTLAFPIPAGILFAALALTAGCADPYGGRQEVSGEVKLKGQPIKDGTVSFEPLEEQDTRATAMISAGDYKIPREFGLRPGRYLIRISAGDGKTPVNPVDENHPPGPTGSTNIISKDLVPKSWNVRSKEERTVEKKGEPNKIDFDIR